MNAWENHSGRNAILHETLSYGYYTLRFVFFRFLVRQIGFEMSYFHGVVQVVDLKAIYS